MLPIKNSVIETVWMEVFPSDNPGSVNIFQDRRIQCSCNICNIMIFLFKIPWTVGVMKPKILYKVMEYL